jgi:nucleotide-binding universal stress UspA family protein
MYEKILVPLDGSHAAEIVIPYIVDTAVKFGSEVNLVSVAEHDITGLENLYNSYLEQVREKMIFQLKRYGSTGEIKEQSKVLAGKPADEILRYADANGIGLIIMATGASSATEKWPLGSVWTRVIRASTHPVLLIRSPVNTAALQEKNIIKKILAPLDGSKSGEAALPFMETLALASGAQIVLMHVIEPVPTIAPPHMYTAPQWAVQYEQSIMDMAHFYINDIANKLKQKGIVSSNVLITGLPEEQIIDYSEKNDIDIIGISTRGWAGISRWVFGNVTDKVLRVGSKSVLVVRPA